MNIAIEHNLSPTATVSLAPQFNESGAQEIQTRTATPNDVTAILKLIKKVKENLSACEQHFLKDKSQAKILDHINAGFPSVLLFKQHELVGASFATPQYATENLGATNLPACFNEGAQLCIGTVAIDPNEKGAGLGTKIIQATINAVEDYNNNQTIGRFESVIAKVSLLNTASRKTFGKCGFEEATDILYDQDGTYPFTVFEKKLNQPNEPTP